MKQRTKQEINKIDNYGAHKWAEKEIKYKFGFKDCCVCTKSTVSCGEYLNAEYLFTNSRVI